MKNSPWFLATYLCATLFFTFTAHAETEPKGLVAITPQGDQVLLHPNGRWEFIDTNKAKQAKEIAQQFPENQGCPSGTQGGFPGLGRCVAIGD